MNSIHLSPRLQAVADFVPSDARLADIGSDHAYLPAYLLMKHHITYAVAGEVAQGPFDNATHELKRRDLLAQAEARLADGLSAVYEDDHIDTVTIAGMGGILISDILTAAFDRHQVFETLILQANTDEVVVRNWLNEHGYQIKAESVTQEDNHFYEVILATLGSQQLSHMDLNFGPYLRVEQSATFIAKWQKESDRIQVIFAQLEAANKMDTKAYRDWQVRYNEIQQVLS